MNKDLLLKIDENSGGVIWITTESINSSQDFFHEMNYLLDGLISRELIEKETIDEKNSLFFANSFSHPFFIIHHKYTTLKDLKDIESNIKICPKSDRKKILIINESDLSSEEISKTLKLKEHQIHFINEG